MTSRSLRSPLLTLLVASVSFSACSSGTANPTAVTGDLPSESRVTTTTADTRTTVTIPAAEPESVEDVLDRVEDTGEVRAADLRYLLLDAEGFNSALEPLTGPGTLRGEGQLLSSALPASRIASLGTVLGFSRTFDTNSGLFALRSDAYLLASDADAKTFASRYIAELMSAGVATSSSPALSSKFPKGSLGDPSFMGVYRTPGSSDPRTCHSIAIATTSRFVLAVTVDHVDCQITTSEWSAALAKISKQRAEAALVK
jgi:hypothetical protein